jgi:hypothetical protein
MQQPEVLNITKMWYFCMTKGMVTQVMCFAEEKAVG